MSHRFSEGRWNLGRRSFLKLSGAALASASDMTRASAQIPRGLTSTPGPDDLASAEMEYSFTDLFNMPVFANEWGYGQVSKSVSGVTGITFPPYACCGVPDVTWSPGLLSSCELVVNGQLLSIAPPPGNRVKYRWFPQRVDREQTVNGLRIRTRTFMPVKQRAVVEHIELTNISPERQKLTLGFNMQAAVIKKTTFWMAGCPGEGGNRQEWNAANSRITFIAQQSQAASAQGIYPVAQGLHGGHVLQYELQLAPGETQSFQYVNAIADTAQEANRIHDHLQATFADAEKENEQFYAGMLRALFTPGNSFFSGHLPTLHTDDETLWNLYFAGIRNLISARRSSPDSKYGPVYLTLGGHTLPTLSFPWDTSLTGLSLALLDPAALRNIVEVWFAQDMHQHLATDYVSGTAVGPWYAVNDVAIVGCARDYLRVTGDFAWLDRSVNGKAVLDHLSDHALYWEKLIHTDRGLADYGNIENLLEVVSTYLHEVAGINAGNVSSMRFVAELLDRRGESARANELRFKSKQLAERINRLLYVEGKGWWRAGQLDGTFNEVRHCYDFLAVASNMAADLAPAQRTEMTRFFWTQLRTGKWMRALSTGDSDATWNIRPDHSCIGAYASWPPMSAKALYRLGMPEEQIAGWLREVAKAGNQGPIGQAHFVEDVWPPLKGGAFKCPNDPPYINEWCCIAGGAFTDMVIDTLFGVNVSLDDLRVESRLAQFDPKAELRGFRHHEKTYSIDNQGAHASR
ncbi:MAG TPA: hypothetical protein VGM11_12935 [Acidobacteriaceae bacterium]